MLLVPSAWKSIKPLLDDAGFVNAQLIPDPSYVETLCQGEDVFYQQIQELLPEGTSPRDYVTSLKVVAVKPDAQTSNR